MASKLIHFRLHGIDNAYTMKVENGTDINETISNNILLDIVNSKRTNAIITSYAISFYEGQPMHIYCGEDNIFFKSEGVDHRINLKGIKRLQSDYIVA